MRPLKDRLGEEWFEILNPEFDKDYMLKLGTRLVAEKDVVPSQPEWFKAYEYVQPSKLKVLVLGQDPYIKGEAMGLAFSSQNGMTPSLVVMYKELEREYNVWRRQTDLTDWARQGVMLLNTTLTTRFGETGAHKYWGWDLFIAATLRHISTLQHPYVVMAWGASAKEGVRSYLVNPSSLVLTAFHPQAENYNPANKFIGCGHFRKANEFLEQHGIRPIKWV